MRVGKLRVDFRAVKYGAAIVAAALMLPCPGCIKPGTPPANPQGNMAPATGGSQSVAPAVAATSSQEAIPETVNIEGSSTVYLIAQAMAVEFEKTGNYKVSLNRSGTGGGYKKFALRQCDLWNASRSIAEKEKAELKDKGIEWQEFQIGIDGISIAVNPKNDWCTELTIGDLRKLWKPDSTVQKWSELNPQWPDQKIELFGADTDSGTFEYFTEVVVGTKNSSRTSYQAAADDNVLIQGVARSKFSLGYIPFGYCVENRDRVKVLKVSPSLEAEGAPAVEPTVETILSGEYRPLSRPLYIYANVEALKRPEVAAFLRFALSPTGQPLVTKRGFVRIPEDQRLEMVSRFEATMDSIRAGGGSNAAGQPASDPKDANSQK